jgi:transposase
MVKLAAFLVKHLHGIVAYTRHRVRFGVVESLNTISNHLQSRWYEEGPWKGPLIEL